MKFLKQKKNQYIIIMLTAGLILLLMMLSSISSLGDLFSSPEKINNADNISFELIPKAIAEQEVPRNSKEALDAKLAVQQGKDRVADSREISFSAIGKKLISGNKVDQSSNTSQVVSSVDNEEILSTVFSKESPKKSNLTGADIYRAQVNPATSEEQEMQQEIKRIYNTPQSSIASDQQAPKETDKERRARLLKHGFSNLQSDDNQKDNNTVAKTKSSQLSCVVHGFQTVKVGGRLILRTLQEGKTTDNIIIPINTLLYGSARLSENRVIIECTAVKIQNNIHSISYSILGSDGLEGIAIQSSPVQKAASDATSQQASSQVSRMAASNPFTATLSLIASDVNSAMKQEKRIEITLVDGQKLILRSK